MVNSGVKKVKSASQGKQKPAAKKPGKNARKKEVRIDLPDGHVATMPRAERAKLARVAKKEKCEEIIPLSSPNTVYLTSSDFPTGTYNNDLAWQENFEACLGNYLASHAPPVPVGPANFKAYCWWFMIDRLRKVGGLVPEPNYSVVPSFPDNGNVPTAVAKFVEYLMPYLDPDTGASYQFRYSYTYGAGTPASTSVVINPGAPSGDFGFGSLGNFFLIPSPTPAPGSTNELTWTFINQAFSFMNDTVANNQDISQWISSTGEKCQAKDVPYVAPDASAVAIPVAHNNAIGMNPGVYCQSRHFDPEMACILHPPIVAGTIVTANYFNLVPFDWCIKALPQVFNAGLSKVFGANSNLQCNGQLELILNYNYICHNTKYVVGRRERFLHLGQELWPGLQSYCPLYYPLNDQGYQQTVKGIIQLISIYSNDPAPAAGAIEKGVLSDPADYMTLLAFFEGKKLARGMEYAWVGIVLNTSDDVVSQTQYGTEFRSANNNPILEDMLDVWAPVVRDGRLEVPYWDYRPITTYGFTYNTNLTTVNKNVHRWIQIGNDFASAQGNINDFSPLLAGAYQGYTNGPWVFNQQQTGGVNWAVRGPGQNTGAPNFTLNINSATLGVTSPSNAVYVLNDVIGPAAPCVYANRIINKAVELLGPEGVATWLSFNYAKLGGYSNLTQISANMVPDAMSQSTAAGAGNYIRFNFKMIQQRLGCYCKLDKESVGRSFAYSRRIAFLSTTASPIADRFPIEQNQGGNSPVQDALSMNTQLGAGSNFNRTVQAKITAGCNPIEAVRSALGPMHIDLIPNFASDEYKLWQAFEAILRDRKYYATAGYHQEHGMSLVSYNSPNFIDQFFTGLFDVGERIVTTVGNVLGGGLGNVLTGVATNLATDYLGNQFVAPTPPVKRLQLAKRFKPMLVQAPKRVDKSNIRKLNETAVKRAITILAKIPIKHDLIGDEPGPTTDEIVEAALARLRIEMGFKLLGGGTTPAL